MPENSVLIDGVHVPRFLYGTAWKEDRTQPLVEQALRQGFRGIDTANQRRHYHEAAVGQALAASIGAGLVRRDELFLQTKFTFEPGQDHRLPYDPAAPIGRQVEQSFESSLRHLGVDGLDSYLLHGPTQRQGLVDDDWAAWRAMEAIHDSGRVRWLGISNVTARQLEELCRTARVLPRFVQNRCYASTGWDRQVRATCRAHDIAYQGFSLLTANRDVLARDALAQIARGRQRSAAQIAFRFAIDAGMIPLTGTSSPAHMRADLEVFDFELERPEVELIERLGMA